MSFTVIIPARFAAQRLPGKPLLDIGGKTMVQHTWERAKASDADRVAIATDDERIAGVVQSFGGEVLMTSPDHRSGTDRLQEAAAQLGLTESAIVVNVQADEPLLPASCINQVASNLQVNPETGIATLCEVITRQDEIGDPNSVKVVMDGRGHALYFSRATIPHGASASAKNCYRHIGLYAYRVAVLNQFVQWPPAALELDEKLEQLRALSNGIAIHVAVSDARIPPGVDTEKDLEQVRQHVARQSAPGTE